jgi:hypothetical protein
LTPCDPSQPPSTTLATLLGIGQSSTGLMYVADQSPTAGTLLRVFVSDGGALLRKHVAGSGQSGASEYGILFTDPAGYYAPAEAGAQSLFVETEGGAATAMALGPPQPKAFLDDPGVVATPLALLAPTAVAGLAIVNLPNVVAYVADVADGSALVVTAPMDDADASHWRVYYGSPASMVEGAVVNTEQSFSGALDITFQVDSSTFEVQFPVVFGPDAGPLGAFGPGTLTLGDGGILTATLRDPTPTTLVGFTFECLAGH